VKILKTIHTRVWPEGSQKNFDDFMTKGYYLIPVWNSVTFELEGAYKIVRVV
jgi:hypothetical protein